MAQSRRESQDWLLSFLDYAKDSETPFKMLYWSGVAAIAGALRRNCWLDQGRYELYPNFYIVFIAKPGVVAKTTTINYAIKLLKKIKGINFAPKSCTWEAFINTLEGMHQADTDHIAVENEINKTAAITVVAGEFGTFYQADSEGMTSALTDLWDCPPDFEKVTKFSGSEFIEKPCVNLFGGATPAWMRDNFTQYSREGGLASRIIFVHGTAKRQFITRPSRPPVDLEVKLVRDLEYISNLKGEFQIAKDAFAFHDKWYHEHNSRMAEGSLAATGFTDRKQAHILKLAMVISASRRDSLLITLDDITEATTKINEIEPDFERSFEAVSERQELKPFTDIEAFIQKAGDDGVKVRKVYAHFASRFTHREIEAALKSLSFAGRVQLHTTVAGDLLKWRDENGGN